MDRKIDFGIAEFKFALAKVTPIIISYIIVGISFGILAYDAGLSFLWTFLSSVFVYAGAGQITLVALLKAGTPMIIIGLMGLALAGRFAFYGISLIESYQAAGKFYPYLVFGLTDEAYSLMVSISYPKGLNQNAINIFITLIIHLAWILGSVLGHSFGRSLGLNIPGLDFMLTAFFITVVIEKWKGGYKFSILASLAACLISMGLFGRDNFIIPAIILSIASILYESKLRKVASYV